MPEPPNYIFAASVASLDDPLSKLLSPRFPGNVIPPAHSMSPFQISAGFEVVDFYTKKPLNLGKPKRRGGLPSLKNGWTALSFKAGVKPCRYGQVTKSHMDYVFAPKPELNRHRIVRYELKPNLPFALERRLWYPVEEAWQIYNYNKSYLSCLQIESLENLKNERDYALNMMRAGRWSYWTMVRDAEIGMFGESPEFGRKPKVGRITPSHGRGRYELLSYQGKRGQPGGHRATSTFNPEERTTHLNARQSTRGNENAAMHCVYGETLDLIVEEDVYEKRAPSTNPPRTRQSHIRKRVWVPPESATPAAAPSIITAMEGSLGLNLKLANSGERRSVDSGFAESPSVISARAPLPLEFQNENSATTTSQDRHQRDIPFDPFKHEYGAISTPGDDNSSFSPYEVTVNRVQSVVDKASRIRRSSLDSLKKVYRARPTKQTVVIMPSPDIEGVADGAPLFKPWTIGDQSIATHRNPRKWVTFVKNKLGILL